MHKPKDLDAVFQKVDMIRHILMCRVSGKNPGYAARQNGRGLKVSIHAPMQRATRSLEGNTTDTSRDYSFLFVSMQIVTGRPFTALPFPL